MDLVTKIAMFLLIVQATDCVVFPENKQPIRSIEFDELPSLTIAGNNGEINGLQVVKQMAIVGREMIVVGARAKLIFLDPMKMSPNEDNLSSVTPDLVHTWSSDSQSREICAMKGQSKDECDNFIKVIESLNDAGDKLFICGTNAYDPVCQTFQVTRNSNDVLEIIADENSLVSGKEKCPFSPDQSGVSLYSGGSLYTSTISEFKGRSSVVSRNGENENEPALKTSRHDTNLLNKPTFISMTDAGDRIFVFMNEKVDNDNGDVKMMSRIAQVCKNDQGGEHVLVKQWTTFVKTRLNCSYHGFYFDQLQDITQPRKINTAVGVQEVVLATFTSPEFAAPASAICVFTIDSMRDAMISDFKTDIVENEEGSPTPPSDEHHPGLCPGEQLSPAELQFIKSHPSLTKQVSGSLLATDTSKRWTALAIDSEAGPRNDYTVIFVGTSTGDIARYLAPDDKVVSGMPLSMQDVYDVKKCGEKSSRNVERIIVNKDTRTLSISFKSCIVNIPLHTCAAHASEEHCVLSADPYCGWNGESCVLYSNENDKFSQNLPNAANKPIIILPKDYLNSDTNGTGHLDESVGVKEPQSDDADAGEVEIVENEDREEAFVSKQEDRIKTAGNSYSAIPCIPLVGLIIALVIGFAAAVVCGCVCFRFGRRQRMTKNEDDCALESKLSLSLQKTTNIIHNLSPHRNRKNEKHSLNNTRSNVPLIPQKNSNSSYSDIINEPNELNSTLLRSTSKSKNSRHSSVTSQPYPPRYSTLRPNSQTSANVHSSDTLDKKYAESDTLCFRENDNRHSKLAARHSMPPPSHNTPGKPMNTIERRQKAEDATQEIMRDSSNCMQETENCFNTIMSNMTDDTRQRLDSDDSGKGESPRNSLKTEEEKVPPPIPSPSDKPKRPMSLPMAPGVNQARRTRLNSEPTMESSPHKYNQMRKMPQRTHSMLTQGSNHMPYQPYATVNRAVVSQATTPNGQPMYSPMYHQQKQMNNYSTLPKKVPPPYHQQMSLQNAKFNNNNPIVHNYEMYNNPQNKFSSLPLRRSKGMGQAYSVPANRGSNGSEYANAYPPQHNTLTRQSSQHAPHFSTLQHPRSNNNSGNERPSTLQRRGKLPSLMRQTSNQTNPKVVPTPQIPSSHQTIDENCAV